MSAALKVAVAALSAIVALVSGFGVVSALGHGSDTGDQATSATHQAVLEQFKRADILQIVLGSPLITSRALGTSILANQPLSRALRELAGSISTLTADSSVLSRLRAVQGALIQECIGGSYGNLYVRRLDTSVQDMEGAKNVLSWTGGISRVNVQALAVSGSSAGIRAQVYVWDASVVPPAGSASSRDFTVALYTARLDETASLIKTPEGWVEVSDHRYVHPIKASRVRM